MQFSLFDQRVERDEMDYHVLPPSQKQQAFARSIAARGKLDLPPDVMVDRRRLSHWIDQNKGARAGDRFDRYPSAKQVGFAEKIAARKRRHIPPECFRDRALMSRWIDANR